jgi:hypothetical protein
VPTTQAGIFQFLVSFNNGAVQSHFKSFKVAIMKSNNNTTLTPNPTEFPELAEFAEQASSTISSE